MRKIILASQSPRRHELLSMAGIEHEVITSECDENIKESDPAVLVSKLSQRKAESVASLLKKDPSGSASSYVVVGADTIVCLNGTVLGKPADTEDAVRMLKSLSGNTHTVYTGVSLIDTGSGKQATFCEATRVTFFPVTEEEIRRYVETKDPLDKAGSYGIQGPGCFLVERIEGDYYTVVGFPIARFIRVLQDF